MRLEPLSSWSMRLMSTAQDADRRAMMKLVFADRLAYSRETGFQTPEISLPFKALEEISGPKREMAHPVRFEPTTSAFGGQRSIH